MTWLSDLIYGAGAEATSGSASLAPLVIYLVIAIFGFIVLSIVFRKISKRIHFKSIGNPLFPVRINWEDKYSNIEGYISEFPLYTDDVFESLEQQEGIEVNTEILRNMKDAGQLNTYFLNVSDEGDTDDEFNKKVFIISALPLEDVGWLDKKGKRYMYSWFDRVRRKNLFFLKTSARFTITNPDDDVEDWWIVSPKANGNTSTFVGYKGNKNFEPLQHVFSSTTIEGGKKLAQESSYVKHLAEALAQNSYYKKMFETYEKLHGEKIVQLIEKHVKSERWKFDLTQKPYIVLTKEQFEKNTGMNAVWMAVSGFATGVMGFIMPDLIPIAPQSATMLGWIVGIVISLFLFKIMSDQKKKEDFKENVESM